MDKSCLNTYIRDLQCKYKELAKEASHALGVHSSDKDCTLRRLNIVDSYLFSLYYYRTFSSDPTYAYKFKINRTDSKQITIEIDIAGTVFSHTGSGDASSFVQALYRQVVNNTQTPNYKAEFKGDTLYIYSTDKNSSFTFNTNVSISQSQDQDNSVSSTNLEDSLGEILNIWNCLTYKEICGIIYHAYDLMPGSC